jgi:prepilin-type N-terminal cleavage/methylation domain-containing protein
MKQGFTLIELLLVIGIIAILSYLAVPVSFNFYRAQSVEGARSELIEVLTRARRNAVLQKGDSQYGVSINTITSTLSSFDLYKGNASSTRDENFDEVYPQTSNLNITAVGSADIILGDINFSKLAGTTTATGTITISHSGGTESRSILIDDFGNAYKN